MSALAFLLVMLSAAVHARWNFKAKQIANDNPLATLFLGLVFVLAILLIPAIVIAWHTPAHVLMRAVPFMTASGLFQALYGYYLFKGYRQHDVSSLYPLARGIGIVGVAIGSALVFREKISFLGYVSLGLIVAGVVLVGFVSKGRQGFHLLKETTTLLPLAVGLTVVGYSMIDKVGVNIGHSSLYPVLYMAGMMVFNLVFLLPLKVWQNGALQQTWQRRKKLSLNMGLGSIGPYLIILFVFQLGPLTYIVALREVSVAIGAVLGIRYLNESKNAAKIGGIAAIVAGAVLSRLA